MMIWRLRYSNGDIVETGRGDLIALFAAIWRLWIWGSAPWTLRRIERRIT